MKNYIEESFNHIITQYTEADTVKDYLAAVLEEANDVGQVYDQLFDERFIDTAQGKMLDIIGLLVGQPRTLIDATQLSFFGFENAPGAEPFGELNNLSVGGRWRSYTESTTGNNILTDEEYRVFIRARIIKNYTRATLEEIIYMTQFILGVQIVIITEGDRSYIINIGKNLSENEQALISNIAVMPKPIGVKANYAYFDPAKFLSFSNVNGIPIIGGLGFGSISNSNGGAFSTLII